MRRLFGRLLCRLGWHDWQAWGTSEFHDDLWHECKRCSVRR